MHDQALDPRAAVVAPAVVSAALDCLAHLTDIDPIRPHHMHLVARALGCREPEATALTWRLIATARLFDDPRWPAWSRYYKAAAPQRRRSFDRVLVLLVADMELDVDGWFDAGFFFDALLHQFAGCTLN